MDTFDLNMQFSQSDSLIKQLGIFRTNLARSLERKAKLGETLNTALENEIFSTKEQISSAIVQLRRFLQKYEELAARYGLNTPPEVSIKIEDIKKAISVVDIAPMKRKIEDYSLDELMAELERRKKEAAMPKQLDEIDMGKIRSAAQWYVEGYINGFEDNTTGNPDSLFTEEVVTLVYGEGIWNKIIETKAYRGD